MQMNPVDRDTATHVAGTAHHQPTQPTHATQATTTTTTTMGLEEPSKMDKVKQKVGDVLQKIGLTSDDHHHDGVSTATAIPGHKTHPTTATHGQQHLGHGDGKVMDGPADPLIDYSVNKKELGHDRGVTPANDLLRNRDTHHTDASQQHATHGQQYGTQDHSLQNQQRTNLGQQQPLTQGQQPLSNLDQQQRMTQGQQHTNLGHQQPLTQGQQPLSNLDQQQRMTQGQQHATQGTPGLFGESATRGHHDKNDPRDMQSTYANQQHQHHGLTGDQTTTTTTHQTDHSRDHNRDYKAGGALAPMLDLMNDRMHTNKDKSHGIASDHVSHDNVQRRDQDQHNKHGLLGDHHTTHQTEQHGLLGDKHTTHQTEQHGLLGDKHTTHQTEQHGLLGDKHTSHQTEQHGLDRMTGNRTTGGLHAPLGTHSHQQQQYDSKHGTEKHPFQKANPDFVSKQGTHDVDPKDHRHGNTTKGYDTVPIHHADATHLGHGEQPKQGKMAAMKDKVDHALVKLGVKHDDHLTTPSHTSDPLHDHHNDQHGLHTNTTKQTTTKTSTDGRHVVP